MDKSPLDCVVALSIVAAYLDLWIAKHFID
jgi:hypothetical protein